jgi:hypothetical protein
MRVSMSRLRSISDIYDQGLFQINNNQWTSGTTTTIRYQKPPLTKSRYDQWLEGVMKYFEEGWEIDLVTGGIISPPEKKWQ